MKSADAILTGDWHLREDTPVCRTDDYWAAQEQKLGFIRELQQEHGCPILDAGDLFNTWKPSPRLLAWAIANMPKDFYTVPGNHDLPQHNIDLLYKSGLAVMIESKGNFNCGDAQFPILHDTKDKQALAHTNVNIFGFTWGSPLVIAMRDLNKSKNIAIAHVMTYKGKKPWPGIEAEDALTMLKRLTGYDLILTGHNHKPFTVEHEGRVLVNPGSIMRMTADQGEHRPRVYLWFAETNTVEAVYLPIKQGVVSRAHLDKIEDRDERMEAFVKHLQGDVEIGLSFERNLEAYLSKHKPRRGVRQIINEVMGAEK